MTVTEARRVFANLMQQARTGALSQHAKQKLSQARQLLRRAKRPAMNPRKSYRKPYHSLEPQIFESMAYRGYLIKFNALRNEYWIEKDRAFIGYAQTIPEAKRKIDEIFGDNPKSARRKRKRPAVNPGNWVVTTKKHSTVFYLTSDGLATDIPERAQKFDSRQQALLVAKNANAEVGWRGFVWKVQGLPYNPFQRNNRLDISPKHRERSTGQRGAPNNHTRKNPSRKIQRIGKALEVRYHRTIGRQPGYYKHEIESQRAGLYTVSEGWVYVPGRSILITEGKPRV